MSRIFISIWVNWRNRKNLIQKWALCWCRYVGNSRRELSGSKQSVTCTRRTQKRPPVGIRADGGRAGTEAGVADNRLHHQSGVVGSCSGGSDALAEFTIEDLGSVPAIIQTAANQQSGHLPHHKVRASSTSSKYGKSTAKSICWSRALSSARSNLNLTSYRKVSYTSKNQPSGVFLDSIEFCNRWSSTCKSR